MGPWSLILKAYGPCLLNPFSEVWTLCRALYGVPPANETRGSERAHVVDRLDKLIST